MQSNGLCQTTPVPNALFDEALSHLKPVELKVLLLIIRKTWGFYDPNTTTKRKQLERIALSYLALKIGSSRRAISDAINRLCISGYIDVFDDSGNKLHTPHSRQGKLRLLFRVKFQPTNPRPEIEHKHNLPEKNFLTIKEIFNINNLSEKK